MIGIRSLLKRRRFITTVVFTSASLAMDISRNDSGNDDWKTKLSRLNLQDLSSSLDELKIISHAQFNATVPGQLGFGFMMGYSSGYCVKKLSKVVAFVVGGFFISIQTLAYYGYLQINMEKLGSDVDKAMDLNKDGKVDVNDAIFAYENILPILQYNMPTGGGFVVGLGLGLRA